MKKYFRFIKRLYEKKIDGSGLAVFRIAYSAVLLCEVLQLFYFRHLIFDKIPYLEPSEIDFTPALIAWMITIVFLMLGLFTRQAAIINYLFSLVFIATIRSYEYHMFYLYMSMNFLLMFMEVSRVNSLDSLRWKLKYSNTRFTYEPTRKVSVLNYYIPLLLGIAFVYFDSTFFKFTSYNWMTGIGMWLPSSLPQIAHFDTSFFLNVKWLVMALGYLTLVFEAVFIFVFYRKKWRIPLFIIGVFLHIGIIIQFPIPWFGLGVTAVYLLMVPVSYWGLIRNKSKRSLPLLTVFYDEECPLCNRTRIVLSHFDLREAISFRGIQSNDLNGTRLEKVGVNEMLDSLYSVTRNGKILSGIDTYRQAFLHMPAFFLLGVVLYLPGFYHIGRGVYSKVAKNRTLERCNEQNCGYTPPAIPFLTDNITLLRSYKIKDFRILAISIILFVLALFQLNVTYNSKLINELKTSFGIDN